MKSFFEYISEKHQDQIGDDQDSEYNAAIDAFQIILKKKSEHATSFLNNMKEIMPELKPVLQKYGLNAFSPLDTKIYKHRHKFDNTGLGDKSVDIAASGSNAGDIAKGDDIVLPNVADGYSQN